jgi:hypothetical protein
MRISSGLRNCSAVIVPVMPLGPVFARVGSTAFAGGAAGCVVVVVVVTTGFVVVVVVAGGFVVVVVAGGLVVVVVAGGLVVVVVGLDSSRSTGGARCGRSVAESAGGGEVSIGSQAAPRTTSAKAQISTPAERRVIAGPIRP